MVFRAGALHSLRSCLVLAGFARSCQALSPLRGEMTFITRCPSGKKPKDSQERLLRRLPEALPASDTTSSTKSDMSASEPFISKGTVEHSTNCEFLLKIYHFLSFWKSLSSTKLTYTQTLSAIYALTLVLTRTSRKTHFRLWANQ